MTERPRDATRNDGKRRRETSAARSSGRSGRKGISLMHTATIAAAAFVMGALAATVVPGIYGNVSKAPGSASGSSTPDQVAAFEPKSGAPPRPFRDVLVEPNVDPSAVPKDRTRSVETVGPAIEAPRQADQRPAPEPAGEPITVNLQQAPAAANVPPGDVEAATPPSGDAIAVTGLARAKSAVNLRSSPDKDSDTVGVVPADAPLQIVSCEGWCEVVYNGRRGFIYETFIDGPTQ